MAYLVELDAIITAEIPLSSHKIQHVLMSKVKGGGVAFILKSTFSTGVGLKVHIIKMLTSFEMIELSVVRKRDYVRLSRGTTRFPWLYCNPHGSLDTMHSRLIHAH